MLRFWRRGKEKMVGDGALSVASIGEGYRRTHVKRLLEGRVKVVGELAADRRVNFLEVVEPEVVILDCGSHGINPLIALPRLATFAGSPRIVAIKDNSATEGSVADGALDDGELLLHLGADAYADIRDPLALAHALGIGTGPEDEESPTRSDLTAA